MYYELDTICAISTPKGIGGISIIRISGRDSTNIIKKIFSPLPESFESHRIYYGFIKDNFSRKELDEVLVSVMLSPKSYTREDVVEINCHGGYISSQEILKLLIKNGCRLAEPGEFTKRAFLNGRIDLTQAEAVINIINSKNLIATQISEAQLKGKLKNKLNIIKEELVDLLAIVESNIDFDEDVDKIDLDFLDKKIEYILNETSVLLKSYEYSKNFFEGIKIVIAGMPNSGKSSLLNYLLKENRAIISDIPGTTRDTIEEDFQIEGVRVKLIDTAGIRDSNEIIEKEGIKRAFRKIDEADIVIYLFDLIKGLSGFDRKIINELKEKKVIIVGNKCDLTGKLDNSCLNISIKKNINLKTLEMKIKDLVVQKNEYFEADTVITNLRHFNILKNFKDKLENVNTNSDNLDIIAFKLKDSIDELGKITGETTSEDVLDKIFQNFCIGK